MKEIEQSLVPVEQREVDFYGDDLTAVLVEDGEVYVPIRPICDFVGLTWSAQRRRINRDAVLSKKLRGVTVTVTPETGISQRQQMSCLPLKYLNGWLFGVNAERVKEEIRDRVIRYQEECYDILFSAFQKPALPSGVSNTVTALAAVREMGFAIARLAEEQIEFEQRITTTEERLDRAAVIVGDLTQRVATIEKQTSSDKSVTEDQASQISQAVKAVAMALSQQSGRNEYGGVYGELYRRFGITSYKLLPARRFQEAMDWLSEWYQSITDEETPF